MVHELLAELEDVAVQRGAEQAHLLLPGGVGEDPPDVGHEAHVEHPVGLVEDDGGYVAEAQGALAEVVEDTSGGADDYVDALFKSPD